LIVCTRDNAREHRLSCDDIGFVICARVQFFSERRAVVLRATKSQRSLRPTALLFNRIAQYDDKFFYTTLSVFLIFSDESARRDSADSTRASRDSLIRIAPHATHPVRA